MDEVTKKQVLALLDDAQKELQNIADSPLPNVKRFARVVVDVVDVVHTALTESPEPTPEHPEIRHDPHCMYCGVSQEKDPTVTRYQMGTEKAGFVRNWYCMNDMIRLINDGCTVHKMRDQSW